MILLFTIPFFSFGVSYFRFFLLGVGLIGCVNHWILISKTAWLVFFFSDVNLDIHICPVKVVESKLIHNLLSSIINNPLRIWGTHRLWILSRSSCGDIRSLRATLLVWLQIKIDLLHNCFSTNCVSDSICICKSSCSRAWLISSIS